VIIWLIVFALLGMVVGSFKLNVLIDRLPARKSLISPLPHCTSCHKRLPAKDLIPVFSYLWLRGRCRYCGAPLPKRLLWVEAGTGILFPFLYWYYGFSLELAVALFYFCLFLVLMVIDLEHHLILNKVVYPATAAALAISIFLPPSKMIHFDGATASLLSSLPEMGLVQAAIGGGIGLGLFLAIAIAARGGVGLGDVKMVALIGLVTGYLVGAAILLAIISGGLITWVLLIFKPKSRQKSIPFGPFLSLATMATLLWGGSILNWYLGFF
jgi:leader peptidase (prepilin peptidase)/N-methyltransferase